MTGSSASWMGQIARRFTDAGEEGLLNHRTRSRPSPHALLATADELDELRSHVGHDVRSQHGRRYPISELLTLATAAMLAEARSLYAVKGNQPTLLEDITLLSSREAVMDLH